MTVRFAIWDPITGVAGGAAVGLGLRADSGNRYGFG